MATSPAVNAKGAARVGSSGGAFIHRDSSATPDVAARVAAVWLRSHPLRPVSGRGFGTFLADRQHFAGRRSESDKRRY